MRKIIFLSLVFMSSLFATQILGKTYEEISKLVQEVCPIKNVDIDKHKDWAGYLELKDGSIIALSSPKYTFAYMLIEQKRVGQDSVKSVYVTDYKNKKLINAKTAYYVFGSNIMSVGGDDLIPFALESDAKEFFQGNKGKQIYRFDRMTENFINYLDMR
ncbi:nitrous oxide reductase accessory protein NosL [Aliarcobacter cryaerophilus]|uniref:nitrous oxide reductase accessory protein NosL n=1 Tax=Aliarcobacter cryaerophilus TaxID=28198 RepID=UPI0021B3A57B|nr:nitrous oxide reductase accessory protein NosL [Aliarcobacter cryaerophilus]MCT7515089.1 nitrous oxide reductase accessory protein NosL [Aliarcobacter cryaerophilus]